MEHDLHRLLGRSVEDRQRVGALCRTRRARIAERQREHVELRSLAQTVGQRGQHLRFREDEKASGRHVGLNLLVRIYDCKNWRCETSSDTCRCARAAGTIRATGETGCGSSSVGTARAVYRNERKRGTSGARSLLRARSCSPTSTESAVHPSPGPSTASAISPRCAGKPSRSPSSRSALAQARPSRCSARRHVRTQTTATARCCGS